MIKMKLKIMIMALLLMSVGIGSAVNWLPATEFDGDVDMGGYIISDAKINYTGRVVYFGPYDWCNYVADGTDDHVTLQNAINAVSSTTTVRTTGGGTVFVVPYNYDIGGQVNVYNRVKLSGLSPAFQVKGGYWNASHVQAARMCITFNTSEAFKAHSGAVIENIQFFYPDQVTNDTPIEYPATIYFPQYNSDHIVIRDCLFVNPYYAINATKNGGSAIIQNVRGFPLKYGYKSGIGQGTTRLNQVAFSWAIWPDAESVLIQWVQENGICFYLELDDWIRLDDVSCYGYQYGLYVDGNNDLFLTNSGFDACYIPVYLKNCRHPKISGGYFVAKPAYGGSVGQCGIRFEGVSSDAVIIGNVINSDKGGISAIPSDSICIGNNIIDWGDGTTADMTAISVAGSNTVIMGNVMTMTSSTAHTTGIYIAGSSCTVVGNVIPDFGTYGIQLTSAATDTIISDNNIGKITNAYYLSSGARNVVNGMGYNVGNPNSTGDWKNYGRDGISVIDTGTNTIYRYANGGWWALN